MSSLRDKTISGFFWSVLQNVGGRVSTFFVTILLARLLTPQIFGLVAMLMIFIAVSQSLVNGGFNQALIQKKDVDEEEYSSVFWINLIISLLIYFVLYLTAPLIAEFYKQPVLTILTRVFSLIFVINALSYVQEAKLTKEMHFKTLAFIHIPSTIIGGGVSILMALRDYGVWSIIALQLVTRIAYTIQIWLYSKWKPMLKYNGRKAKKLFTFGARLMVSDIINSVFNNVYLIIIGKFFPLSTVGYYQNANNLVQTPSLTFSDSVTKATFPAFSSILEDNKRLKEGFKKMAQQVLFWTCPMFIIAGVIATPLFRLVFTEKWLPAVPYFRLLCIMGIFLPLQKYNLSIINVKGRSDWYLKLQIIEKIIIVIGLIITVPMGIYAMLAFQAATSVFMYLIDAYFSGKFIDYSMIEQIKDISPVILLGVIDGGVVFLIDYFLGDHLTDLIRVLLESLIGIGFYGITAQKIKIAPYLDFKGILKSKLSLNK